MINKSTLIFIFLCLSCFINCNNKTPIPEIGSSDSNNITLQYISEISVDQLKLFASRLNLSSVSSYIKFGVKSYKVIYATTYNGKPVKASGLLYLPIGMSSPAPALSVQHGTTFIKSEAPSVANSSSGMEYLSSAGYITLIPDYLGYGSSFEISHPYYDAHHAALTVLDMVKAVKYYLKKNHLMVANNQLFLAGYSEGGYVTLATQREIETNSDHHLKLTGVAAGAGGYDLVHMLKNITTTNYYSYPSYLAFIVNSFNSTYGWNQPFNYYFREKYAVKLSELLDGEKTGMYINSQLSTNMDSLFNPTFFQNLKGNGETQFKNALLKNSLTNWKPKSAIRLYHGTLDDIIPLENTKETMLKLKENGGKEIELIEINGGTHGSSFIPMIQSILPWFEKLASEKPL